MKKIEKLSILICGLAALICLLCSCNSENQRYIDDVNSKLVSFTDCEKAFTDSINEISGVRTIPTEAQIDEIENSIDKLSAVCGEIEELSAPKDYADVQAALAKTMGEYRDAMEKCKMLMEFYRGYDEQIRSYPTPDEGSVAMGNKLGELYTDFAEAMWQARDSLLDAKNMIQEN